MARKAKSGNENPVEMNLTPMIDCTFQLIIFFIVVGKMSNDELAALIPPTPTKSISKKPIGAPGKTVLIMNVYGHFKDKKDLHKNERQGTLEVLGYLVAKVDIEAGNEAQITDILKAEKAKHIQRYGTKENFHLEVRADKDLGYSYIFPVMEAAAQAEIADMYMSAVTRKKGK